MTTIYTFGPFRLDADAKMLFRETEPTGLGQRAVALLCALIERTGTPVSKDALVEAAWPGLAVEDSNLTVQIAAVRRVFNEGAGGAEWIETLPRRGYRYVGPPVTIERPGETSAQIAPAFTAANKASTSAWGPSLRRNARIVSTDFFAISGSTPAAAMRAIKSSI
jgi:DNA-binding winged helix-turn-helix (wHTH) protein